MNTNSRVLGSPIYAMFYDITMKLVWFGKEKRFHERILSYLTVNNKDRVLDVGCGTGTMLRELAKLSDEVVGIDASSHMLKVAKKKTKSLSNVKLVEGIAEKMPFQANSFDVIICVMTLHHFPTKDKIDALKEIKRVLKPNGQFLLVDFGKSNCSKGKIVKFVWGYEPHIKDNFCGKLSDLVKTAGFKKIWQDGGCGVISYIKATK